MPWKARVLNEGATGDRATLWRFEPWLFAAFAVIAVAPIWTVSVFPTVDGPAHLAITHVWLTMDRPEGAHFRNYFVENVSLFPNWFCYAALAALMKFLSPFAADRVLVSLFGLSLGGAARFALGAVDPRAKPAAFLVLPLVFNYTLIGGMYNFNFGIVGFLLCLGIFVRSDGLRSWQGIAMFVPALLLTGLTHLSAIALTGLSLGIYAIGLFLSDLTASRAEAIGRLWSRGSRLFLASLPGLVPALLFLVPIDEGEVDDEHERELLRVAQFATVADQVAEKSWPWPVLSSDFGRWPARPCLRRGALRIISGRN